MKRLVYVIALVLWAIACSIVETDKGKSDNVKLVFCVEPFVDGSDDDNDTKTNVVPINNYTSYNFIWSEKDTVGIFPSSGSQIYFSMTDGAGASSAQFDGGGWACRNGYTYRSYFPFIGDIYLDPTKIPVGFTGQKQVGNANSDHFQKYDYMYTPATSNESGQLYFAYNHLISAVLPWVELPAGHYTGLTLSLDDPLFVTEGEYDLTAENPSIVGTEYSNSLHVDLDITFTETETLIAYVPIAPMDMSGRTLRITVTNDEGLAFWYTYTPSKAYVASNIYRLRAASAPNSCIAIADPGFKSYLVAQYDVNGDGEISAEEISEVHSLSVRNRDIRSISELKFFPKLSYLDCAENQMTFIDLYDDRDAWTLGEAIVGYQKSRQREELFRYDGMTYILLNPYRQLKGVSYNKDYRLGDNVQIITDVTFFTAFPERVFLDGNGKGQSVSVFAHNPWQIISYPKWLTITRDGPYDIHITVPVNTGKPRFGEIVVQSKEGQLLSIPVSQGKAVFSQPEWDRAFYHRSLVQEFTWDGCSLDPQCDSHLANLKEDMGDQVEIVNFPGAGTLVCDPAQELQNAYHITGYPSRILAGRLPISGVKNFLSDKDNLLYQEKRNLTHSGMAMESVLHGREIMVNLMVFTKDMDTYLITGLLLEDGIISPQAGTGGGDDYVHNNVVREALTDVFGVPFYSSGIEEIRSFAFKYTVPEEINIGNVRTVFYIRRFTGGYNVVSDGIISYGFYADNVLSCRPAGKVNLRYADEAFSGNEDLGIGGTIVW